MNASEKRHQIQLVGYARRTYPGLITIISPVTKFAGTKGARIYQGLQQRAMGYLSGTPDIFFPYARGGFHGLFIELKRTAGGRLEDQQRDMIKALIAEGYCAVVCRGYDEARMTLDKYMRSERRESAT